MVRLSHRGICISDLETSERFYRDALGFVEEADYGIIEGPDMDQTMEMTGVRLRAKMFRHESGPRVELMQFLHPMAQGAREKRSTLQYGLVHLSFYVDDIDVAAQKIRDAGGTVHDHTRVQNGEGGIILLYCTDPDGVRIELMQDSAIPARFSHSGICVPDVARSLRYYEALGFTAAEDYVFNDATAFLDTINEVEGIRLRAQMIRDADGNTLELLQVYEPDCFGTEERQPLNRFGLTHIAFWDDDMEGTIAALDERGGYFVEAAHVRTPHIELQHGADPVGVRIELMRPVA